MSCASMFCWTDSSGQISKAFLDELSYTQRLHNYNIYPGRVIDHIYGGVVNSFSWSTVTRTAG